METSGWISLRILVLKILWTVRVCRSILYSLVRASPSLIPKDAAEPFTLQGSRCLLKRSSHLHNWQPSYSARNVLGLIREEEDYCTENAIRISESVPTVPGIGFWGCLMREGWVEDSISKIHWLSWDMKFNTLARTQGDWKILLLDLKKAIAKAEWSRNTPVAPADSGERNIEGEGNGHAGTDSLCEARRPTRGHVPWEGLEDMPFTKATRSELVKGAGA